MGHPVCETEELESLGYLGRARVFGQVFNKHVAREPVYDQEVLYPLPGEHVQPERLEGLEISDGDLWFYVRVKLGAWFSFLHTVQLSIIVVICALSPGQKYRVLVAA